MNRKEEILHQSIAVEWHNKHRNDWTMFQRLICYYSNAPDARTGNKMRSMGVKAGVSDWIYMAPNGRVLWIELKIEEGTQSPDQIRFESLCKSLGHEYHIARSRDEFFELLELGGNS